MWRTSFIPIKSINQTVFSEDVLTWTNEKKEKGFPLHQTVLNVHTKPTVQLLVLYYTTEKLV